jgi:hypothetical protein
MIIAQSINNTLIIKAPCLNLKSKCKITVIQRLSMGIKAGYNVRLSSSLPSSKVIKLR